MFLVLLLSSFAFVKEWYWIMVITIPLVLYLIYDYYNYHKKTKAEIEQFVESVHYRDFSRHFDIKSASVDLVPFRAGFNEINSTFKTISKEKETQFLHLKTILEIVDTGIFSYEMESGEVLWMNESLKNMLLIPYLKTVNSLLKRDENLYHTIINLPAGGKTVTKITKNGNSFKVLLSATIFTNETHTYKLIAFQNINEALDEEEAKAWQKLLSVMTHEIMNSVAPISSLAETLKLRISDSVLQDSRNKEALLDIEAGILTIKNRSEGLLKFTETYRNLSKINKINLSEVLVIDLFEPIQQLLTPTIEQLNIEFEVILRNPLLKLKIDAALMEQVLINLLLNAKDAVKDVPHPKISLIAESNNNETIIKIIDNGIGIPEEIMEKIFIPFFSTKKSGSGIGLSLCKQIMLLHKGNIKVRSVEREGSIFILTF